MLQMIWQSEYLKNVENTDTAADQYKTITIFYHGWVDIFPLMGFS